MEAGTIAICRAIRSDDEVVEAIQPVVDFAEAIQSDTIVVS